MYDFLTSPAVYKFIKGPMVWAAFLLFFGGGLYKVSSLMSLAKKDKVVYPYMSLKYSLRSIFHWLVPYASTTWRKRPWITLVTFLFHVCLLVTPVFLLAHNMIFYNSWGIKWWTLPERVADIMTLVVVACSVFFLLRRLMAPEVRFVTFASDYILLAIAAAPFITGFIAFHQLFFDYRPVVILHILFGEIMLAVIPFTRLGHMFFFWLTRAHTGSEFGTFRHTRDY